VSELSAQRIEELQAYIRREYPSARFLSRAIGVSEPDDDDSEGAVWLKGLRESFCDSLAEILESDYPEDTAYEIAGGAAEEVYTYTLWRVFTDLELYRHAEDVTGEMYRLDKMSYMASVALDEFGRTMFSILLNDAQEELARLEEQDELDADLAVPPEIVARLLRDTTPPEPAQADGQDSPDEEIPLMWD
jgi:hypothetical protein